MSHWELVTDYLELNKAIEEHRKWRLKKVKLGDKLG